MLRWGAPRRVSFGAPPLQVARGRLREGSRHPHWSGVAPPASGPRTRWRWRTQGPPPPLIQRTSWYNPPDENLPASHSLACHYSISCPSRRAPPSFAQTPTHARAGGARERRAAQSSEAQGYFTQRLPGGSSGDRLREHRIAQLRGATHSTTVCSACRWRRAISRQARHVRTG